MMNFTCFKPHTHVLPSALLLNISETEIIEIPVRRRHNKLYKGDAEYNGVEIKVFHHTETNRLVLKLIKGNKKITLAQLQAQGTFCQFVEI